MSIYEFDLFKNSDFGETIIYTPKGGSPVSISAVIIRMGLAKSQLRSAENPVQFYPYHVYVDRTNIATITTEDTIVMTDVNGTSKTFRVQAILASDPGAFKLGVA